MRKINKKRPTVQTPTIRPLVYDIESAAQALLLSTSTVRKLIRRGLLPVSRIGDRILIQEKSLLKLLDAAESGKGITTRDLNADWIKEDELVVDSQSDAPAQAAQ
jgi:excisionase family DNA binding protein